MTKTRPVDDTAMPRAVGGSVACARRLRLDVLYFATPPVPWNDTYAAEPSGVMQTP